MVLEAAVYWLLGQVGGSLFSAATRRLSVQMGLSSPLLTSSGVSVLLDDYYRRLEEALKRMIVRLDEDRIAKLKSAIDQLRRSSTTKFRNETLQDALNKFSEITNLPEQGETAKLPNAQLRCLSFLGIAAIHEAINDPQKVIAENIVEAIYADAATAKKWLGDQIVDTLLKQYPPPFPLGNLNKRRPTSPGTILQTYEYSWDTRVNALAWSPDGTRIASAASNKVQIWDPITGRMLVTYTHKAGSGLRSLVSSQGHVNAVTWSPDGTRIASAGSDTMVHVWDATTGKPLFTYQGHTSEVHAVVWSPNGKYIASASIALTDDHYAATTHIWEADTAQFKLDSSNYRNLDARLQSEHNSIIAWSLDSTRSLIVSAGDPMQIWHAFTGQTSVVYEPHTRRFPFPLSHGPSPLALAWSPDGKYIASAHHGMLENKVQIWNASDGTIKMTYSGHKRLINAVTWSPDSQHIASASDDHTVQVWQALTGQYPFTYRHSATVDLVAWSPHEDLIAFSSNSSVVIMQV